MAIDQLRHLPLDDAGAGPDGGVLSLAIAYRLSAYDAAYLWLSISHSMPLATLDRLLAAAACAEHVEILGPLAP
jgi:predicted nucleic acid-binding protein